MKVEGNLLAPTRGRFAAPGGGSPSYNRLLSLYHGVSIVFDHGVGGLILTSSCGHSWLGPRRGPLQLVMVYLGPWPALFGWKDPRDMHGLQLGWKYSWASPV